MGHVGVDQTAFDEPLEQGLRQTDARSAILRLLTAALENLHDAPRAGELYGHGAPRERPTEDADAQAAGEGGGAARCCQLHGAIMNQRSEKHLKRVAPLRAITGLA